MSSRMTALLGWITLFAVLGVIWVLFGEDPSREQGARGETLYAGIDDAVRDASEITLKKGDSQVTLAKTNTGWTVANRDGFAADPARINALLAGVRASIRREPKTSNFENMAQLGLGDAALDLVIKDASGQPFVALDIGKQGTRRGGKALTYVLKAGDSRAWLVTALPDISAEVSFWIDGALDLVSASEIALIEQAGATLTRDTGSADFTLEKADTDGEPVPAYQRGQTADVIGALVLDDVVRLGNPANAPMRSLTVASFDGLMLSIDLYDRAPVTDSAPELWARITATADPAFAESLAGDKTVVEPQTDTKPITVQDRAARINARTSGWLFKLRPSDAQVLMRDRDMFFQKPADNS